MKEWLNRWGLATLLLVAGALLRIGFVRCHPWIAGDSLVYADLAKNMMQHHVFGFTQPAGIKPTLIRLPGYPLFLAACFAVFGMGNFVAVLWVQAVAGLVECWMIGSLAERLMGRKVGLVALGLAALCPFTANYCAVPLTECLSLFCVTLAFFSLERWASGKSWGIWGMGFALAFGVLLRPDQGLLAMTVVPAVVWIGWRRSGVSGLRPAAAVVGILLLPLVFWGARNWRVFHVVQPLAPRYANDPGEPNPYGFQRWYRTWAIDFKATVDVYWTYDGAPVKFGDLPERAFDSPEQKAETQSIFDEYAENDAGNKKLDAEFAQLAEERVKARPVRYYLELPAAKVANMWLRPRTEFMRLPVDWWNFRAHAGASVFSLGYAILNAAYLGLAVVGLWRWRRLGWSGMRSLGYAMVGFVGLRCVLLWTIDNSEPRYTLECFPVVILLAGFALCRRENGQAYPRG